MTAGRGLGPRSRAIAVVVALFAVACSPSGGNRDTERLRGARLEVVAVWTGTEQQRFEEVLRAFERETGATVVYTPAGHDVAEALTERRTTGSLPDVAFIPQPGLLREYVKDGLATPLDADVAREVTRNYPSVWRDLGSVDGRLYAVWFKAANKSLVWYDVGSFERAGVIPPTTLDGLAATAERLTTSGTPAFSLGAADGWTLTDWFENTYAQLAGVEDYDRLAAHRLPWTDPSVLQTLQLLTRMWSPPSVAGGIENALHATFESSVHSFAVRTSGAMLVEGDFVQGLISGEGAARVGVDVDVFPFPSAGRSPVVVGGGDAALILRPSPAAQALLQFLASPRAATVWAAQGGFVSPNVNVDLSIYPDATSRTVARRLIEAGEAFRFDMSDLQPSEFGAVEGSGMRGALQQLLATGDVNAAATALEAEATLAYGGR